MIVTIDDSMYTRLQTWSDTVKRPPEVLIDEALERSLEDWEDYKDALRICAEVDAGSMKTYTLGEVVAHINAMES